MSINSSIPKNLIPNPLIPACPAGRLNPSILVHCCCAPCSGGVITTLLNSDIIPTVLFYNPNIHPEQEYLLRKQALIAFLEKNNLGFIDSDYDPQPWFELTSGMEHEPQRGKRCAVCFRMRLEYSACLAKERGFKIFTSSFGISRWKDMNQVNQAGHDAAQKYGISYWDHNWRKQGGQDLMRQVSQEENFYQQSYCGCQYSML